MKQQRKKPVSRAANPRQAYKTSPHLRVAQHRHTGHVLPRRTTSYPTLVMIVLCLGVFLASWTRFVTADSFIYPGPVTNSYTVHASVPGPPPSIPATINTAQDNTVVTTLPTTVTGSCPLNTYETLYRNGAFSGVGLCDVTGAYQIQTGLFPGTNQLQVRDFSLTDVAGPISNLITMTYNPPTPPVQVTSGGSTTESSTGQGNSPSTTNTGGPIVAGEPLIFKTSFNYEGHYVGDTSTWQLDIEGGTAPYAISVDWGDGQHSLISEARAGTFNIDHVYKQPGGYRGSYVTKFTASDSDGTQTFLQLLAIVNNPPAGAASSGNSSSGQSKAGSGGTGTSSGSGSNAVSGITRTSSYVLTLMKYIWPSYGFVLLMLFSFWLGERREYQHLRPHLKKRHHHA
jgi:hypothetical protein